MHNPQAEAVALAIMDAIRRYSEEGSSVDPAEHSGMADEIEMALRRVFEDLEYRISELESELESR